jgi:hypothetical protein
MLIDIDILSEEDERKPSRKEERSRRSRWRRIEYLRVVVIECAAISGWRGMEAKSKERNNDWSGFGILE